MLKADTIGQDIKKAADIIRKGGIVIYPTETVYGIAANVFSEDALKKVFAIKKRTADKPISIAVSDFKMMDELVYIGEKERGFIEKFLPGPVTVLLKKKKVVPDTLTSGMDLVGIRYPDHKIATELIELAGVPVTSTSANISGEPPPGRVDEIKIDADYILDGGDCKGEPSTVVDLVNMKITRKGARYGEVRDALREISDSVTKIEHDPYITLICSHCEFFKEDDVQLECAAFKVLKNMIQRGIITPEEIKDAFS